MPPSKNTENLRTELIEKLNLIVEKLFEMGHDDFECMDGSVIDLVELSEQIDEVT